MVKGANDRHSSATQDRLGGVVAQCARDTATRVRSGTAHPQPFDRRAVLCPTGQRSHKEHLFERDVAMKNIALGDTEGLLEIKRCIDAARNNRGRHVGRKLADQFGNAVAERVIGIGGENAVDPKSIRQLAQLRSVIVCFGFAKGWDQRKQ